MANLANLLDSTKTLKASHQGRKNLCVSIVVAKSCNRLTISRGLAESICIQNEVYLTLVEGGFLLSTDRLNNDSNRYDTKKDKGGRSVIYCNSLVRALTIELNLNYDNCTSRSSIDVELIEENNIIAAYVKF